MTTAMVLGAGLGTRLRPLTDELPKPLVPIGHEPLLFHICRGLREQGIEQLVVNVHHRREEMLAYLKTLPFKVQVSVERDVLGTAGGIAAARAWFGSEAIIVHNGDILGTPPLAPLLHAASADGLRLAVSRRPLGQGSVGVDAQGRVVRLRGRCFGPETMGADYRGVAAVGPRCVAALPTQGCLIQDFAIPELSRGRLIEGVVTEGEWSDVGTLQAYLRANLEWLGGRPSSLGSKAHVAPGVELDQCVVGAGAEVLGRGRLERCVIWPGARVSAPLNDSIVTRTGQVVAVE